jgi:HD-GYP domain-containing protein (c-di-GMP phosphodiesterase class II)
MPLDLMAQEMTLEDLNHCVPLIVKLESIHRVLKSHLPIVDRIAADIYDAESDLLKTIVESKGQEGLPGHAGYETRLEDVPALREILHSAAPQTVVADTERYWQSPNQRRFRNGRAGYHSTCAMPMYCNGVFIGFVWFNSRKQGAFDAHAMRTLDVFGHMISLVVVDELSKVRLLSGVVKAIRAFSVQRDHETGTHIDRVAQYVRIIANELAPRHGFDEAFIERLFMFAPLHDVGKIAIPDSILLKPGKLDAHETEVMRTHTLRGQELVDELIADFGLDGMDGITMLRNIAMYHHEAMNGSGYPFGLKAAEIPIEARIIAVADVFDALTSKRPYKEAWNNEEAYAMLGQMAGTKLDPECIDALSKHRNQVLEVQKRYTENCYG